VKLLQTLLRGVEICGEHFFFYANSSEYSVLIQEHTSAFIATLIVEDKGDSHTSLSSH
jgi:hypothetical protein